MTIYYCYHIQAWIEKGVIAKCNHSYWQFGCTACQEAGTMYLCEKCKTSSHETPDEDATDLERYGFPDRPDEPL